MKVNISEVVQHANAILMLGFCVSYSFLYLNAYYARLGVVIWVFALPFLYFPNLVIIPGVSKEEMKDAKKISIPAAWLWVLWWTGDLVESSLLRIVAGILLVLFITYCIFYIRKWKREYAFRNSGEEKPMENHG